MNAQLIRTELSPIAYGIPIGLFFFLVGLKIEFFVSAGIGFLICLIIGHGSSGLEVSADRRSMRKYYVLLGVQIGGRWEKLPSIIGVTLKYFSEITHSSSNYKTWGVWKDSSKRYEEIIVMLSVHNSSTGIILSRFPTSYLEQSTAFAHDIAEIFDVPVNKYLP